MKQHELSIASLVLSCMFVTTGAYAQSSCDTGTPAENMPDEFSQFAFIIGDFDVNFRRMTEDGWSEPLGHARWNGRYTLDGRAIMDWWYEEGDDGAAGINIRMFDPAEKVWKTAWHYTANLEVRELHQRVFEEDGRLHLWQVYPEADERNVYFETYGDGRWARIEQRRDAETGEWSPAVMLEAVPAGCVPVRRVRDAAEPETSYEHCDNCGTFPDAFMQVDPDALLDLASMQPERRLDFLVGEWQLYYPEDEPAGFEEFHWWLPGKILEGSQDWSLDPAHRDKIPWRAKSYFRYYRDPGRWQFQWISSNTSSLFSGRLEEGNVMAFYENEFSGGPDHLVLSYPSKYVFRNITKDSFVVEWYDSDDGGRTYRNLAWRLYYKRRVNQFAD